MVLALQPGAGPGYFISAENRDRNLEAPVVLLKRYE
jgi:hypothetical protein